MKKDRIGVFGGTFNPPHIGHVHAAQIASKELSMQVLFIPDNIPPHKKLPPHSATPQQRLEMTRIAAQQVEGAQTLDMEICRSGPSYTADTIEDIARMYPQSELWLIVGTDMLCTLNTWYQPERIFAKANILALARGYGDASEILEYAEKLRASFSAVIKFIDCEPIPVSSSQIRDGLYSGMDKWLPEGVFAYIKERGLYLET